MCQPQKQMKGKSKDRTPKPPPPVAQKPPNTKLMLQVPPHLSATPQAVPLTISPRTLELTPEAGPLQPHEDIDSDKHMFEVPYVLSPRQLLNDLFWEDQVTNVHESNQKQDLGSVCSELFPNKTTSHPENAKDPGLPGAGGKRKASTHSLECSSSVSDDSDLPLSIQPTMSKKARKTLREPTEVEETDEELDKGNTLLYIS